MCGIVGIYNSTSAPDIDRQTAQAMAEQLRRRGPDAHGVLAIGNTVFAHRRLSIIDLSDRSDQPMKDLAGSCMITFNGEIYNYKELKKELEAEGIKFSTSGDTEVILQLYCKKGIEALDKLDGMFAFAIYNKQQNSLLMMRDRLGKKPLYYFVAPDGAVIFASTLQALKKHPAWQNELNPEAVKDFIALSYIPHDSCVYKNVYQLPPACRILFKADGRAEQQCYWKINYQNKLDITFEDASQILQKKLLNAVAKRLIADVPCGLFLSGGVDSAAVSALSALQSSSTLHAYTIGFNENKYDERSLAAETVKFLNERKKECIKHHTQVVDCRSFDLLQELIPVYGEPFGDFSLLPTALLSKFAAQQHKAVLSGDGADEIFGGYERYRAMRYCALLDAAVPSFLLRWLARGAGFLFPDHGKRSKRSQICRLLSLSAAPEQLRYMLLMCKTTAETEAQLFGEKLQYDPNFIKKNLAKSLLEVTAYDLAERYAECDLKTYLPDDILVKVDRASMYSSLEVRSPFLDKDVVEFAAKLPFEYKQKGCSRKRILKHAVKDLISPEVAAGPKRGFAVPVGSWFRNEWKSRIQIHLLEGRLIKDHWLDRRGTEDLLKAHNTYKSDHSELIGNLLMLELFLESID